MNEYYFFGSGDSSDYDVLVRVDHIPANVDAAHDICKSFNQLLAEKYTDKAINSNLCVIEDGRITRVFKGTCDELTNCLFYTYGLHVQEYACPVVSPVIRDVDEKILRVARFILTFFSRTELRSEIKKALRGDLTEKYNCLKKIDFLTMRDFPGKKEKGEDIYKVIAFQFGQVFSLLDFKEPRSYTKSDIVENYPSFTKHIYRMPLDDDDMVALNDAMSRFLGIVDYGIMHNMRLTEK